MVFVPAGSRLVLTYRASAAPTLPMRGDVWVRHRTGIKRYSVSVTSYTTDRTSVETFGEVFFEEGEVVAAFAGGPGWGAVQRGAFWAYLFAQTGVSNIPIATGYIHAEGLQLGQFDRPGPGGGDGNLRSITGTNRAAGVELSETVPTNAMWRLLGMQYVVVGGAADFVTRLQITDGTNVIWQARSITVTATGSETHIFAINQAHNETAGVSHIELPKDLLLREGYVIATTGITPDDDYAAPQLHVEEWLVI